MSYSTTTRGLVLMGMDAEKHGRNKQIDTDLLAKDIHPDGTHVCVMSFIHNDVEMRGEWLIRLRDDMDPKGCIDIDGMKAVRLWIDCGLDVWGACTTEVTT
jgi:hypothetical protein